MRTQRTIHGAFLPAAFAAVVMVLCVTGGCGGETDTVIRKKFDAVVESDFRSIVTDLPKKSCADSVFFRIAEYSTFTKGLYRVKAVVDFFYLRDVNVKRSVKYRYDKRGGKWERYANDYIHF